MGGVDEPSLMCRRVKTRLGVARPQASWPTGHSPIGLFWILAGPANEQNSGVGHQNEASTER